jgi:hypothetical protein
MNRLDNQNEIAQRNVRIPGDWKRHVNLANLAVGWSSLQIQDCRHHFWSWSVLFRRYKEARTEPYRRLDEQNKVPWGLNGEGGVQRSRPLLLFPFCQVTHKTGNSLIKTWIWRHNPNQGRWRWRAAMHDLHQTCKWRGCETNWKLPKDVRGGGGGRRERKFCLFVDPRGKRFPRRVEGWRKVEADAVSMPERDSWPYGRIIRVDGMQICATSKHVSAVNYELTLSYCHPHRQE